MGRESRFSLTAAILILLNAIGLVIVTAWFPWIMPTLPGTSGNDPTTMYTLSSAGLIFGVMVLIGSILFELKPDHRKAWGTMVLVFSVSSVIMGGGFIVGLVLGIASGILALSHNSKMSLPKTEITK